MDLQKKLEKQSKSIEALNRKVITLSQVLHSTMLQNEKLKEEVDKLCQLLETICTPK